MVDMNNIVFGCDNMSLGRSLPKFQGNMCFLSGSSCAMKLILFKVILISIHLCLDRPSRLSFRFRKNEAESQSEHN
jgi:hypothetical protein